MFARLDVDFGRTEGDEEIQDLLKGSEGLNLGLHYLPGAIAYDPSVKIDPLLASKIMWLDAFKEIAEGNKDFGPIALLDIAERFRWLTSVRGSVLQTSRPHPGKTINLDKTFARLFEELVK